MLIFILLDKPNCIWIVCDQLRAQALSCNGDPNVRTPNIDILAYSGINFKNAVGGYPLCCPFRGSMLTGIYPHKCVPGHQYRLPTDKITAADIFKNNGYHTSYIGKWHLDGFDESTGRTAFHIIPKDRRGRFDYWLCYENNNSQYDCYVHGNDGDDEIELYKLKGYETDELTSLFIEQLRSSLKSDKPFFSVLSVQPPHDPYIAPPEFMKNFSPSSLIMRENVPNVDYIMETARSELSGAYAMIENLDYNIGRIVSFLRENNLYDNTNIIFFSDHGDMHGSHGLFRKTNPYEESIRVPFIISGRQACYDGFYTGNVNNPINHIDILPTSLGLCNLNIPDFIEGTDYSGLRIKKEKIDYPKAAYIQYVIPTMHGNSEEFPWRGIVTEDGFKYVCYENRPWLMFDLNTDKYEQVNLATNPFYHYKRKQLHSILKEFIFKTNDDFMIGE